MEQGKVSRLKSEKGRKSFPFKPRLAPAFQISPASPPRSHKARPSATGPRPLPWWFSGLPILPAHSLTPPTAPASFPVRWVLIGPAVGSEGGRWGRCRSDSAGGVRRWRRRVALSIITTIINSSSSPPQGLRRRRRHLPHHSAPAWPRGPPQPPLRWVAWPPSPPRGTA